MRFQRWGKLGLTVVVAVAMTALLAACGSSDDTTGGSTSGGGGGETASGDPFEVRVLTALSGPAGAAGEAEQQGIEAAAQVINEEGGIDGREVVIDTSDTGGDATNAVAAIKSELRDDPPDLVFPGSTSDETLALCPLLAQAGVLSVGVTADPKVGDPSVCPNNFSVSPSGEIQVEIIGEYMKEQGYEKVGLLTATDAYGRAIADAAKETLPELGLEVVAAEEFDPEATSIIEQWQGLKSSGAEVVFLEGQGPAIAKAIDGRHQTNVDIPVIGGTGAAQANPGSLVADPAELKGVDLMTYGVQVKGKAPFPDRYNKAVKLFDQLNGGDYPVGMMQYTLGYDVLAAVQTAAAEAGASDSESLSEAFEQFADSPPKDPTWLTHEEIAFSPESHFPTKVVFVPAAGSEMKGGMLEPAEGS